MRTQFVETFSRSASIFQLYHNFWPLSRPFQFVWDFAAEGFHKPLQSTACQGRGGRCSSRGLWSEGCKAWRVV
jgi:hypothetical protein